MHSFEPPAQKPSLLGIGAFMALLAIFVILGFFFAADKIVKQALLPPQAKIASPTPSPTPHVIADVAQEPRANATASAPANETNATIANKTMETTPPPTIASSPEPTLSPTPKPVLQLFYSRDAALLELRKEGIGKPLRARFGDLNGDGAVDFVVFNGLAKEQAYFNDLKPAWARENPPTVAEANALDAPGAVWDLDNDRKAEVVALRFEGSNATLVVADGATGNALRKAQWPGGIDGARIAIAKPRGEIWPNFIIVLSGSNAGSKPAWSVTAYDPQLRLQWSYSREGNNSLARALLVDDFDNNNAGEVFAGGVLLDAATGKVLWQADVGVVADAASADLDGDGVKEVIAAVGESGIIVLRSGGGTVMWKRATRASAFVDASGFRSEATPSIFSGSNSSLELLDSSGGAWWEASSNASAFGARSCIFEDGRPLVLFGNRLYRGDGAESELPGTGIECFDLRGDDREEVLLLRKLGELHYVEVLANQKPVEQRPQLLRDFTYALRKAGVG